MNNSSSFNFLESPKYANSVERNNYFSPLELIEIPKNLDSFINLSEFEDNYSKIENTKPRMGRTLEADNNYDFQIYNISKNFNKVLENTQNSAYSIKRSQRWIGYTEEIKANIFTAKLKDLTNGGSDEYAEFDIIEVSKDDLIYLKKGAVFYFTLGYCYEKGQVKKQSFLKFQRLTEFTDSQINSALDRATTLYENLNWE